MGTPNSMKILFDTSLSALSLVRINEELLERKVVAPV
jgi:hypothetical protein